MDKIYQYCGIFWWAFVGTEDGIVGQQQYKVILYLIDFLWNSIQNLFFHKSIIVLEFIGIDADDQNRLSIYFDLSDGIYIGKIVTDLGYFPIQEEVFFWFSLIQG